MDKNLTGYFLLNGQLSLVDLEDRSGVVLKNIDASSWCEPVGHQLFATPFIHCLQAEYYRLHSREQISDGETDLTGCRCVRGCASFSSKHLRPQPSNCLGFVWIDVTEAARRATDDVAI